MLYLLLLHPLALTLQFSFQITLTACLPALTSLSVSIASFLKDVKNALPGQMMLHLA